MKTELSPHAICSFLEKLEENRTADERTKIITKIYEQGYRAGENDTICCIEPEYISVGNKVCDNMKETLKAEFLAEIFDKYSEQDFRQMVKNYDLYLEQKRKEVLELV